MQWQWPKQGDRALIATHEQWLPPTWYEKVAALTQKPQGSGDQHMHLKAGMGALVFNYYKKFSLMLLCLNNLNTK